ncbi:aldo/keto reductase family protein [Cohnella thailandensis]|uniref:Aldo/keto reductase family protein n=1 Tax=Cohnella thailandensis TaxID=557557 RepID=A0A841T3M1_9BACL|nr:aldo/keto reductase family protein [Cohnella thailandensis]MBB6636958.1 aldo/keto reductase family protein [Cohnella thailandensis]MBP1973159.1 voltage-dependent potassium channel beta subunit [Cohnella thailandensis]
MKYRKLGSTGLKVSEISFGSWMTYGHTVGEDIGAKLIDKAFELGINFIDTANVYERGEAEKMLGDVLPKYPRESYVLATKAFWPMGDGPNDRGLSRKHVTEQLNASLKRLKQDYVDIFYCHRYDPETPLHETLRTIEDFVRQGKVLYVGVSEWTGAQIQEAMQVADKYLLDRIVVNQPQYNMFYRNIESDVLPVSEKNGISQVVFSPLAQGALTGKYRLGQQLPQGSRATDPKTNMWIKGFLTESHLRKVDQLDGIAKELGMSLSSLALAWILRHDSVASALVGATKVSQLEENAKASGVVLPQEALDRIEEILVQP